MNYSSNNVRIQSGDKLKLNKGYKKSDHSEINNLDLESPDNIIQKILLDTYERTMIHSHTTF